MGGYGSGRRKQHHIISECLPLDTSFLLKRKMLIGKREQGATITFTGSATDIKGKVTETHHNLFCIVERYGDEGGELSKWDASSHLTLVYGAKQGEQQKSFRQQIPLVVTHPNYGGVRWWYLAPCCGRRARVLYFPIYGGLEQCVPHCRECLELNYASQRQSYIERHKTYERHLLANYGWAWAEMEYHCLREHYLEITPEIEYTRQRSILQMRMRMLRLLISSTRLMMGMDARNLRSLRSQEDRQMYMDHVVKEHGETYGLELVRMFGLGIEMERQARASAAEVFDQAYNQLEKLLALM